MSEIIQTKALVLKRTNFQEADRILTLLTENGQISAIARGARKERSKLAGGIEPFCLSKLSLVKGKGEIYTITSAVSIVFYQNLLKNLETLNLASELLTLVKKYSKNINSSHFLDLSSEFLLALNSDYNHNLVKIWTIINLAQIIGEPINLNTDFTGEKLKPELLYHWDFASQAFSHHELGEFTANHIKLMRLFSVSSLAKSAKIKQQDHLLIDILPIIQSAFH